MYEPGYRANKTFWEPSTISAELRIFARISPNLPEKLPKKMTSKGILPGFSPNQKFWGCAYTSA